MRSILRLAVTPWIGFLTMAVAEAINLLVGRQPWFGEILLSALWPWTAVYLGGPVLVAVAAWDGARLLDQHGRSIWGHPEVRRRFAIRLWLTATLASVFPILCVVVPAAAYAAPAWGQSAVAALWAVLAGVATIAATVAWGLTAGSLWGPLYGPIAAFGAYGGLLVLAYGAQSPPLMVGGAGGSLLGLTIRGMSMALASLCIAVLIVCAMGVLLRRRSIMSIKFASGVLIASLVPGVLVSVTPIPRFHSVANPFDGVSCVELGPQSRPAGRGRVCTFIEHRHAQSLVVNAWSRIDAAAKRGGVTVFPSLLVEQPPGATGSYAPDKPGQYATFTMSGDQLDPRHQPVSDEWLVTQIVNPDWCAAVWGDEAPPDALMQASEDAGTALNTLLSAKSATSRAAAAKDFNRSWETLTRCGSGTQGKP